jgi:hypothetical protein
MQSTQTRPPSCRLRRLLAVFLALPLFLSAGCSPTSQLQEPLITFEAFLDIRAEGDATLVLIIQNEGDSDFSGDQTFEGQMVIRSADGTPRVETLVHQVGPIPAGARTQIMDWKGILEPGDYTLSWGSVKYGGFERPFTVEAGQAAGFSLGE